MGKPHKKKKKKGAAINDWACGLVREIFFRSSFPIDLLSSLSHYLCNSWPISGRLLQRSSSPLPTMWVSLSPPVSLSLYDFFSPWITISLFPQHSRLTSDHGGGDKLASTRLLEWTRRIRMGGRLLPSCRCATHDGKQLLVWGTRQSNHETLSLATPPTISRCQSIPLGHLVVMISSVHDESVWIVGTLFPCKMMKLWQ